MTLILKQVFGFLKLLNSDTGTRSIAAGLALGLVLGFSPALSLQALLVFCVILLFRVQAGAAFFAGFVFKVPGLLLAPLFHEIGKRVLEASSLQSIWTTLYQAPIVPFTRFNNSVVMGGGIVALLLVIPAYFLFVRLVAVYRVQVKARFERTRFWKFVKATTLFKWYAHYEQLS